MHIDTKPSAQTPRGTAASLLRNGGSERAVINSNYQQKRMKRCCLRGHCPSASLLLFDAGERSADIPDA